MADGEDETTAAVKRAAQRASKAAAQAESAVSDMADTATDQLQEQVASLGDQLSRLAAEVEAFATTSIAEARDLAAGAGYAGAMAARGASRQVGAAARAVRSDPVPAIVALGVMALVVAMFVGRGSQR